MTQAGLAVADPPLPRLEQSSGGPWRLLDWAGVFGATSGSREGSRPQRGLVSSRPPSQAAIAGAAPVMGMCLTPGYPTPVPHRGCPGRAGCPEVGPSLPLLRLGGRTLTDLGNPSGPTQAGREEERGSVGMLGSQTQRAEATGPGTRPCRPGHPTPGQALLPAKSPMSRPNSPLRLGTGRECEHPGRDGSGLGPPPPRPPAPHSAAAPWGLRGRRSPQARTQTSVCVLKRVSPSGQKQPSASPLPPPLWLLQKKVGGPGTLDLCKWPSEGEGQRAWQRTAADPLPRARSWGGRGRGRKPQGPEAGGPHALLVWPRPSGRLYLESQVAGCAGPHGRYTLSGGQVTSADTETGVRWAEGAKAPGAGPTHRTARGWHCASRCTRPGHGRAPRRPPGCGKALGGRRPGSRH